MQHLDKAMSHQNPLKNHLNQIVLIFDELVIHLIFPLNKYFFHMF